MSNFSSLSTAWNSSVDGAVYAEPLSFDGLVIVATENDSVYAFNSTSGSVAWSAHLGTPANSTASPFKCNGGGPDIIPTIGITGTPVIDSATGTLYVAALINGTGYDLFALNVNSGRQLWHTAISAPGFNYLPEEERGALALANGLVYVPFGGYSWSCFYPGPTGWVVAMSVTGAGEKYAYNVPATPEADIWTPEGVSVDQSGNVYVVTGDSDNTTFNFGNAVIKLSPTIAFVDSTQNYFASTNWNYTNQNDLDLGITGATLIPGNLIFVIGKDGIGYLLDANNLGGIGGQLYSSYICQYGGLGSTSYANGVVYVPCADGLHALSIHDGTKPSFSTLWNSSFFAGPAIITPGAVWSLGITTGNLYVLNPGTGSIIAQTSVGPMEHFVTPSIAGQSVVVAANETVYAFSPG